MSKAYDRFSWDCIVKVLRKIWFSTTLGLDYYPVHLNVSFKTFHNGRVDEPFLPKCGLR